jgi:tetratricopeptide (TPR) repeat protein
MIPTKYKIVKAVLIFFLLVAGPGYLFAQTKDMQRKIEEARKKMEQLQKDPKIKEAMQKAQEAMKQLKSDPEIQKQMAESQQMLDSMKKTNPALANVNIPDINNFQLPDFDSVSASMEKGVALFQNMNKTLDESLPKQDLSHHAEQLPKLGDDDIPVLADGLLKKIKPGINMIMKSALDKMLKDPSVNIAATGAFILASGGSPDAAAFLICKGILKNPKDRWAINDLGVYFRDNADYPKSLQCYFYANSLDNGRSKVINVNIGWAAAYYGDFNTATKYFDKALIIDQNYSEALEGEALIAFQQGDIEKLYECLAKEVKFADFSEGPTGNGPSENFATICATQRRKLR